MSHLPTLYSLIKEVFSVPVGSLHGLRHSYATYLLFKGYSLKEIQELLGHSNIRITGELYTHFLAEMNKRAAVAFSGLKKGVK